MKGYDFDGVVSYGIKPEEGSVIITGSSYQEAARILPISGNIPVYFNPIPIEQKTNKNAAAWKVEMIKRLAIDEWFDDDLYTIDIIKNNCPEIKVHLVYTK